MSCARRSHFVVGRTCAEKLLSQLPPYPPPFGRPLPEGKGLFVYGPRASPIFKLRGAFFLTRRTTPVEPSEPVEPFNPNPEPRTLNPPTYPHSYFFPRMI